MKATNIYNDKRSGHEVLMEVKLYSEKPSNQSVFSSHRSSRYHIPISVHICRPTETYIRSHNTAESGSMAANPKMYGFDMQSVTKGSGIAIMRYLTADIKWVLRWQFANTTTKTCSTTSKSPISQGPTRYPTIDHVSSVTKFVVSTNFRVL